MIINVSVTGFAAVGCRRSGNVCQPVARSWSSRHLRGWSSSERQKRRDVGTWVLRLGNPCERRPLPVDGARPVPSGTAWRSPTPRSFRLHRDHRPNQPHQPRFYRRHLWRHGLPVTSYIPAASAELRVTYFKVAAKNDATFSVSHNQIYLAPKS